MWSFNFLEDPLKCYVGQYGWTKFGLRKRIGSKISDSGTESSDQLALPAEVPEGCSKGRVAMVPNCGEWAGNYEVQVAGALGPYVKLHPLGI